MAGSLILYDYPLACLSALQRRWAIGRLRDPHLYCCVALWTSAPSWSDAVVAAWLSPFFLFGPQPPVLLGQTQGGGMQVPVTDTWPLTLHCLVCFKGKGYSCLSELSICLRIILFSTGTCKREKKNVLLNFHGRMYRFSGGVETFLAWRDLCVIWASAMNKEWVRRGQGGQLSCGFQGKVWTVCKQCVEGTLSVEIMKGMGFNRNRVWWVAVAWWSGNLVFQICEIHFCPLRKVLYVQEEFM